MTPPTQVHGKAYAIDMPVTINGDGPASPEDTVYTWYEVWDQVCQTICRCQNRGDAELIARLINYDNQEFGN